MKIQFKDKAEAIDTLADCAALAGLIRYNLDDGNLSNEVAGACSILNDLLDELYGFFEENKNK